jgi:hypothetical protein
MTYGHDIAVPLLAKLSQLFGKFDMQVVAGFVGEEVSYRKSSE